MRTEHTQGYLEREGLEPDEGVSQISNLRKSFEIRTPHFPSKTHIWHSIWHWTNSASCELLAPSHIAEHRHFLSGPRSTSRRTTGAKRRGI